MRVREPKNGAKKMPRTSAAHKNASKKKIVRPVINKRQTRLLEGAMAGGFAFVIGSVFLMSSLQNFFMATNQFASVVSAVLVDLTNADRVAQNLGDLTMNPVLSAAAQAKANDMAAKSYFAHTSPEGLDSWHWFKQVGYDFRHAGENLAVDFSDSVDVERAWMNSPTHRDNILNGKYTEIGIATAPGTYQGRPTVFVVQMFGTPRNAVATQGAGETALQSVPEDPRALATASNPEQSPVLGEQFDAPAMPEPDETQREPQPRQAVAAVAKPIPKSGESVARVSEIAAPTNEPGAERNEKPIGAIVQRQSEDWHMLATSPSSTLKYSYYLIGILVLLALAVETGFEIKWHHRKRAASAGCMLALMVGLFWYADYSMFRHATVAEASEVVTQSL